MEPDGHGMRRGVEPIPGAAEVGPAGGQRAGTRRVVPGSAVKQPSGHHRSGGVEPVRRAVACVQARCHGVRRGVEPVPRTVQVEPAGGEGAGASRVVPGPAVEHPAGRHGAGGVEPVRCAVTHMEARRHGTARVGVEPVPGTAGVKPAGRGDAVRKPVPGAVDEAPAVKGAAAAEVAADAPRVRLVARQHGPRPGVEAVGHAADGYGAARQRAGSRRVVPGPAVEHPSGRHGAGRIKPVQGAVALVEPGSHGAARVGLEPVPGAAQAQPTGIYLAIRGGIIPNAIF